MHTNLIPTNPSHSNSTANVQCPKTLNICNILIQTNNYNVQIQPKTI